MQKAQWLLPYDPRQTTGSALETLALSLWMSSCPGTEPGCGKLQEVKQIYASVDTLDLNAFRFHIKF